MSGPDTPSRTLLLVEDNPGDVHLMCRVLEQLDIPPRVEAVPDGEDALRFLRREDRFAEAPRPDLVLLDLNMPRMGGHDCLREIRATPDLATTPVIIFTSSISDGDIGRAYKLGANACVRKPFDIGGLRAATASMATFWLRTAQLPPG